MSDIDVRVVLFPSPRGGLSPHYDSAAAAAGPRGDGRHSRLSLVLRP